MTPPVSMAHPSGPARCIEANLYGHLAWVHRHAGMVVWDEPALLLVDSGLASDTFNKVARARFAAPSSRQEISRAAGHFRQARRPFAWWVGPSCRPLDIEARLQEMGFRAAECEIGMCVELRDLWEAPHAAGLTVERVSPSQHLQDLSQVLAANWQPPDSAVASFYQAAAPLLLAPDGRMRYFVGFIDGEPVAVSGLYLQGGVGGIYAVATRQAFRGRGFGSRLAWAAADEARRAGAKLAVLQAAEDGQAIYRRLGFQECCCFAEYALPAQDSALSTGSAPDT